MSLPWYIPLIKIFFVNVSNSYTVSKITNAKPRKKTVNILILLLCLLVGFIYALIRIKTNILVAGSIYYFTFIIIYLIFSNTSIVKAVMVSLISNAMTIICMLLSTIINFALLKIFKLNLDEYNIIEYIVIGIMQNLLIYFFFRIKRFKNGFTFLKNNNNDFAKEGSILGTIFIILAILTGRETEDIVLFTICNLAIILGGILMIYWIKKSITKYYKEKMKERTVEIQQEQIKQQDEKIKNLQTELADVLQINHKYSHRISAMEKAVTKLGTKLQANEEFAEEYGDILSSIKKLSKEYKEEVASVIKETKLPKTNIFSIDNLLEYMK